MRSVRQASGALDALATLMPDTAELVDVDGGTEEVPADRLSPADVFLVRPGGSAPADGEVAAVEGDSEHLIARGIKEAAEARGLELPAVHDFRVLKGRGVSATVDGAKLHVGGPRLLEAEGAPTPAELARFAEAAGQRGASVVNLVREGDPVAALAIEDVIRPDNPTGTGGTGAAAILSVSGWGCGNCEP